MMFLYRFGTRKPKQDLYTFSPRRTRERGYSASAVPPLNGSPGPKSEILTTLGESNTRMGLIRKRSSSVGDITTKRAPDLSPQNNQLYIKPDPDPLLRKLECLIDDLCTPSELHVILL